MARPHADPELARRIAIAVFELVAARGVRGASMRDVAKKAKLSTGTLTYHFKTKDGLLRAALDYAYQRPSDWGSYEGSAREALHRLARRYVLIRPEVRVWWRFWCAVTAHASSDRKVAERQKENHGFLVGFFAEIVARGVARGEFAKAAVAEVAERLCALAHGLALRQLVDDRPAVCRKAQRILAAEIDAL